MSRVRKLKPYVEGEFTNHLGHVIKVNDPVISVTTCTGRAHINVGRYLGYREYEFYRGKRQSVLVEVNAKRSEFVHKVTDEKYNFNKEYKDIPYPTYPNGSLFASEAVIKYNKLRAEHGIKTTNARKDYEWKEFPYKRISNLILNKVYPADMTFAALVGSTI